MKRTKKEKRWFVYEGITIEPLKNAWWESSRFRALEQNTGLILYVIGSSKTQVLSTLILPSSR